MPAWDAYLTPRDREVFSREGFGARPAILVVDMTYAFVGDRPEPLLDSIRQWPQSSGEDGWRAARSIRALLEAARGAGAPVFYTTPTETRAPRRWREKNARRAESDARADRNVIVPEIAPHPDDVVIRKERPSAFFGTPLLTHLVERGVDSVIVAGGTTSGCVRATVVDAFSYGLRVAVVEECVFDRGEASHAMSLFDMQQKYADVVTLRAAIASLGATAERSADAPVAVPGD